MQLGKDSGLAGTFLHVRLSSGLVAGPTTRCVHAGRLVTHPFHQEYGAFVSPQLQALC